VPVAFSPPYRWNPAKNVDTGVSQKKRAPAPRKREPCNKRNGIYFISMGHEQLPPVGPPPRSAPSNDWKIGESSQIIVNFPLSARKTDGQRSRRRGNNPKSKVWGWIREMRRGPLLIVWLVLGMSTVFCCCETGEGAGGHFFFYFFFRIRRGF
jgi:predicted small secreted protein